MSEQPNIPASYATVKVECNGHVLLAGTLEHYAVRGRAGEGEVLAFVYRDPFDPEAPDEPRPVRRARLVVEELGIVAEVEQPPAPTPEEWARLDKGQEEWAALPGVTDTYPSTSIADNAEHVEDDQRYQLVLDNSVILVGTFREIRAEVAERVTTRLATDPGNLAAEVGLINQAFTGGDVEIVVASHGEWSTLFGATGKNPVHIKVTRLEE